MVTVTAPADSTTIAFATFSACNRRKSALCAKLHGLVINTSGSAQSPRQNAPRRAEDEARIRSVKAMSDRVHKFLARTERLIVIEANQQLT